MNSSFQSIALQYVISFGLNVIPIAPGQKSPPMIGGWVGRKSTAKTVSDEWGHHPGANIGVVMGGGLVDIETDLKPGVNGEKSLTEWAESARIVIPPTWSFKSGGGGIHRIFRCDGDFPNKVGILPAVDIRGKGGYAVFPPSLHPSGNRYEWLPGCSPDDMPGGPAPVPPELFFLLADDHKPPLETPVEIVEGSRNDTLFKLACKLRQAGLSEAEIFGAVCVMNGSRCVPPLGDDEVATVCRQAAKYKPGALPGAATHEDTESVFSAENLLEADLGETEYIVVDMLPQGLALLTSPPKYGKSWLVLDLCLSVTRGFNFMGHGTHPNSCLYLALEDSPRRLKSRMKKLLNGTPAPDNLIFRTTAPDIDHGLMDILEQHMIQYTTTGVIVIDTLQTVRGQSGRTESAYQYDYREMRVLKSFADRHGIVILLVHHLRKAGDDADPHNRISGTNGLLGAADTSWVITKAKKSDDTATLSITGRDVESSDLAIRFDTESCRWQSLGNVEDVNAQNTLLEYRQNPVVRVILELLQRHGGKWRGTMSDLMSAGREIAGVNLADNARALGVTVRGLERQLFENDRVTQTRIKNGNAGYIYAFSNGGCSPIIDNPSG